MVERQLAARGIRDPRVLEAMGAIPRELFVSSRYRDAAYDDAPAPIGHGQTISQPYMTALMCQELALTGREFVLDIGTGSGYHAAVLGSLAARVLSIEIVPELCDQAQSNLTSARLGANVRILCGDGSTGYPEAMPYDAISVAAAAPEIPAALLDQLADPGRLVIPVGSREEQDLRVILKSGSRIETRISTLCRFVPLLGREGWK